MWPARTSTQASLQAALVPWSLPTSPLRQSQHLLKPTGKPTRKLMRTWLWRSPSPPASPVPEQAAAPAAVQPGPADGQTGADTGLPGDAGLAPPAQPSPVAAEPAGAELDEADEADVDVAADPEQLQPALQPAASASPEPAQEHTAQHAEPAHTQDGAAAAASTEVAAEGSAEYPPEAVTLQPEIAEHEAAADPASAEEADAQVLEADDAGPSELPIRKVTTR